MTTAAPSDLSQPATLRPARRPQSRWWALVVLSLAQLMVIMDTTIIIVALPSAQSSLGISDTTRQWVVTAYTLAFGGLLLLGGRLADRLGQRTTLLIAMIGFAAASAVSGSAMNGVMLIVSRAAQGAFGALLVPSATSFIALLFPVTEREERARALGILSAISIGGAAFGFILGGLLTNLLTWRWCLYINIPLGVVAVLGAILNHPQSRQERGCAPRHLGRAALRRGHGGARLRPRRRDGGQLGLATRADCACSGGRAPRRLRCAPALRPQSVATPYAW